MSARRTCRGPKRIEIISKAALLRLAILFAVLALVLLAAWFVMIRMPGASYAGPLQPLDSAGIALRDELKRDVQWSFWENGYPAIMVTDTAPFRYRQYHTALDTPDEIDYERLARVVAGLEAVVADLAGAPK